MKVWISKYALTKGLFELDVSQVSDDGKSVYGKAWQDCYHGEGKEWHRTKDDAVLRAKEMQKKKLQSLQAQMEKIEKMTF